MFNPMKAFSQCPDNTCGTVSGAGSSAFNDGTAPSLSSFVVGERAYAYSDYSIILGIKSVANSSKSYILGYNNSIESFSNNSLAIGFGNTVFSGNGNCALIGHDNEAYGEYTLGLGKGLILNGQHSAAFGEDLITEISAPYSIAIGFGTSTFEPYSLAFAAGSTTPAIYVKGNDTPSYVGFVGICNKTPKAELDVLGDIRITGENTSLLFGKAQESIQEQWGLRNKDGAFVIFEPSIEINPGKAPEIEKIRLYIEDETGNVGINTSRPQHQLSVNGNIMVGSDNGSLLFTDDPLDPDATWGKWGIEYHNGGLNFWRPFQGSGGSGKGGDNTDNTLNYALFISDTDGKIGIGTELPETQLHVNGDLRVTDLANPDFNALKRFTAVDDAGNFIAPEGLLIKSDNAVGIGLSTLGERQTFIEQGNTAKLYVNGGIMATELWVKLLTEWSDFVFADNYNLRPLHEVESYIKKHKHLPDIPSATEVAEEGINVGQMDVKLLQKIEELTLYVIEQQKQIDEQQKHIIQQQKDLNKLYKKMQIKE